MQFRKHVIITTIINGLEVNFSLYAYFVLQVPVLLSDPAVAMIDKISCALKMYSEVVVFEDNDRRCNSCTIA